MALYAGRIAHHGIAVRDVMLHRAGIVREVRTTVTLDPDTEAIVRKRMRERGQSFKDALNGAIRSGAAADAQPEPFRTRTASLGQSRVNLERALTVAVDIVADEL